MAHRKFRGAPPELIWPLLDILDDASPFIAIQKSAQVGVTDLLITLALYAADTGYADRGNVLYLMPTQNQMDDFAQARFDTAITESSYLRSRLLAEPPRRKGADNKRLKRLGKGLIFMRSAEERQVASIDADLVILDEFDQMPEGTLELAQKRLVSSANGKLIVASTPRYPETGINGLYLNSDRMRYWILCISCGTEQTLDWPASIDFAKLAVVCKNCAEPLDRSVVGRWRPAIPDPTEIRGYHLSRLYSPWLNLGTLIRASESTSLREAKEFHNSDLGEVYSPPGAGMTLADLDNCRDGYTFNEYSGEPCVMGVDVGNVLHVVIREDTGNLRTDDPVPSRLWFAGTVNGFEALSDLMTRYCVTSCVVDALPETRSAMSFARGNRDVTLAYYTNTDIHRRERITRTDVFRVVINRSLAFEELVDHYRGGFRPIPSNARQIGGGGQFSYGDYYRQVMAVKPVREEDTSENWTDRWSNRGKPDHYAHAELYAMMAAGAGRRIPWTMS